MIMSRRLSYQYSRGGNLIMNPQRHDLVMCVPDLFSSSCSLLELTEPR